MNTEKREVTVTGTGDSMQRAFQDALNSMRKKLLTGRREALLNADPVEVTVVKAERHVWTERFFGILFKREREKFQLTIRFVVAVSFVDLDAIHVTDVDSNLNLTQRVLQLR